MAPPITQGRKSGSETPYAGLFLTAAILLLPAIFPEKTGWLTSIVPLPVFYYLVRLGRKPGAVLIRNAVIIAAIGALLFGSLPMLIFSLTLVPLGIALSLSVFKGKSPVVSGFTGSMALACSWLLYWSVLALMHQTNPYAALLQELDIGLHNGLMLYEKSAAIAPETLENVQRAVAQLRIYIPKILPGLLVSALLGTAWLNLVLGSWLLRQKDTKLLFWPDYNEWKLPESFVWLVVLSGAIFLLLPQPLSLLGLNGLIICCTIYFFQGLAIAASLLKRWSVPRLIRIFIYALIFIQTYGIIVLSFLGLVDVWADFRKLNQAGDNPNISA